MTLFNKAAANALPEGLTNPLIARAKNGQLPDSLPLWDIAELLFEHRRVPGTFYGIFEGINFKSFVHKQVMGNLVKVQGYTQKEMSGPGIPKGTKEPIIHRDEIKICLELAGAWPIDEDGCLLANWWKEATPEPQTNHATDEEQNPKRKKLIPLERETTESLLLIYRIAESRGIEFLDQLPAAEAWGLIVSKKFTDDLIKTQPSRDTGTLMLNGGETLDKKNFTAKYRSRFKTPTETQNRR